MSGVNCEKRKKINSLIGVLFREPQYFLPRYTTSMPLSNFPLVHHLPNSKPSYQANSYEGSKTTAYGVHKYVFLILQICWCHSQKSAPSWSSLSPAASLGLFPFMHAPMFSVPPAHLGFALCQSPQNISSKQDCTHLQFKNGKIHFAFNHCPYVGQGGLFWMRLSSMMEDGDENHMLCRAAASVPQGHGAINAPSPLPGKPAWSTAAWNLLQSQPIVF